VKFEFIGLPELDESSLKTISLLAEKTIRRYLFSRIPKRAFLNFNLIIEVDFQDGLMINVDIDAVLHPKYNFDLECLIENAVSKCFIEIENWLRGFKNVGN